MTLTRNELRALGDGATCITANRYLRELSMYAYACSSEADGRRAWPSPDVVTWPAWLMRGFQRIALEDGFPVPASELPLLLSSAHERLLWEQIIAQSGLPGADLQIHGLAGLARSAWQTLREWEIPLDELSASNGHAGSRAFMSWAYSFRDRCAQSGWLDLASVPEWLRRHAMPCLTEVSTPLLLRGFVRRSPVRESLLAATGRPLYGFGRDQYMPEIQRHAGADPAAEMRSAARWAAVRLEQEPDARIECLRSAPAGG